MAKKQAISRFKKFINLISEKDVIAVMPDIDVDGISSGVLVYKCLEKIKKITPQILQFQHTRSCFTEETLEYFKERKVTKIIVTDQAFDQIPEQIKDAEKFADILIVDHHEFYHNVNSKKTTLIKAPMLKPKEEGSQYCAAKMIYDLFSEIQDISEFKWIASLGIIADNNLQTFKSFVRQEMKKQGIKWQNDIFKTKIGRAVSILSAADAANPPKLQLAFETLYTAENLDEIINSKLNKLSKKVEDEINFYYKNYEKFTEDFPDLNIMFVEINSRFRIKSPLVNKLSIRKFPKKVVLVFSPANQYGDIKISARNQEAGKSKRAVKVSKLLEYATKGLEGSAAGGHAPAAGATVKKQDWLKFKQRVLLYMEKAGKNGI